MIEDLFDLVSAAMNTVGDRVAISVEMFVVEEVDPMPAVFMARGMVQMEGGHRTIEPVPLNVVADPFVFSIEIKAGDAPTVVISTISELVTTELNQKLRTVVVVPGGDLLR